MLRESVVILVILGIAGYAFLRSKRNTWASGVFPLMLVPLLNILFPPKHLYKLDDGHLIRLAVYLVWFAAMSLWAILWSRRLSDGGKKSRIAYIACTIGFTLIFILVLIFKGMTID